MKKQKLCYIIPRYERKTTTHYAHIYQFLGLLGRKVDVFFYAESGDRSVRIPHLAGFSVQPRQLLPLRIAVRIWWFLKLRLSGYRLFYCHYAELSTIIVSLITKVFGGTTFKWHCAQEHHYKKPWSLIHLSEKISREIPLSLSLRLADYLVTCSPLLRTYYEQRFGIEKSKVIVVPAMVNMKAFLNGDKVTIKKKLGLPDTPIALFVHQLSRRKGADRLVDLAKIMKKNGFKFTILAIGEGPLKNVLQKRISQLHLNNELVLCGAVPSIELPKYYLASDLFIMPSRIEEFGRVLVEAMAAGLPILATKTLGTDHLLTKKQQEFVFPQTDFQKIAEAAAQLLTDATRVRRLSRLGKIRAKEFASEAVVKIFTERVLMIRTTENAAYVRD